MFYDDRRLAGLLLFASTAVFLIAHIVAEAVAPTYSVSSNAISDLGVRAGAPIFNTAMVVLGALLLLTTYFFYRTFHDRIVSGLQFAAGVGAMGVGIVNDTGPGAGNALFLLAAVLRIRLLAVAAYRDSQPPLAPIGIFAGSRALGADPAAAPG